MRKNYFLTIISILIALGSNAQTALNFDGVNDYATSNTLIPLTVTNTFTYEAWVYPTDSHEVDAQGTSGFGGLAGQNFLVWPTNGSLIYGSSTHSTAGISVGTNGVSVYEHTTSYLPCLLSLEFPIVGWTHIAVVCNNKSYLLYINGYPVKIGATSTKANVHPALGDGIGGGQYGYYKGSVDDMRLWNYARSQEEIISDMKRCIPPTETGLVALYDFNDGTPSTVATDLVGGVNATLTNMDENTDWVPGITCFDLEDRNVFTQDTVICAGDSAKIVIENSQAGAYYFFTDTLTGAEVGPAAGNGDSAFVNTGSLLNSATYNAFALADYAADLPGSDDHVRFSTPFSDYADEITIESWVYSDNGQFPYAGQATDGSDNMSTNVWLWDGGTFYVNDGGTWRSLVFPTLSAGWTHVATVAKPSGLYIYYDGVAVDSSTTGISNGITVNNSSVIDLGHDPRYAAGTAGRNTNTAFDDFRVWKSARTEAAIATNMDLCIFFGDTNLVQHTTFEEGAGTILTSMVGSNGEIMNPSTNWILGATGCPSYAIDLSQQVTVTVNPVDSTLIKVTACDSYTWPNNGMTYTSSVDTVRDTLVNVYGCDSIVRLDLKIVYSSSATVDTTILQGDSLTVGTSVYYTDGTYTDTITNTAGCDSIVTTNLSIYVDGISNTLYQRLRIFPNPAQDFVTIAGTLPGMEKHIRILNVLGQDITNELRMDVNPTHMKLDVSNLASGVYMVKTPGQIYRLTIEK